MATELGPLRLAIDLSSVQRAMAALDELEGKMGKMGTATIKAEKQVHRLGTTLNTKVVRNGVLAALIIRRLALSSNLLTEVAGVVNDALGALISVVFLPLMPLFEALIDSIIWLAEEFEKLPAPIQTVLSLLAGIGALSLVLDVGSILTSLAKIGPAVAGLGPALAGAGAALAPLLANPIVLAIMAIIALLVLLYLAWQENWFGIRDIVAAVWESIGPTVEKGWNLLKSVFSVGAGLITEVLETLWAVIETGFTLAVTPFRLFWEFIDGFIIGLTGKSGFQWIIDVLRDLQGIMGPVFDGMRIVIEKMWSVVKPIFDGIQAALGGVRDALNLISGRGLGEAIGTKMRGLPDFLGRLTGATRRQHGGLVTRPEIALLGEAGPELVIPLRGLRGGGRSVDNSVSIGSLTMNSPSPMTPDVSSFRSQRFWQDMNFRGASGRSFQYA